MKNIKWGILINISCGVVALAELSQPGQLSFGFPFVQESLNQFKKVPDAYTKVANNVGSELDKVSNTASNPQQPIAKPSPEPSPQQCGNGVFSALDAATIEVKLSNMSRADIEKVLGTGCNGEYQGSNGVKVKIEFEGDKPK